MGKNADISWLHPPGWLPGATWSPWHGCAKKHTGCLNCWAETMSHRFGKDNWGRGKPRRVTAESGWKHPLAWARAAAHAGKRMLVSPLDCDPLDAEVYQRTTAPSTIAARFEFDRFMQTIRETGYVGPRTLREQCLGVKGGLTWLLLTKRPENWRWIPEDVRPYCWLLYSASDQPSLDAGMPHLLAAEGFAGLGLSLEPLVGPVDLDPTQCHDCGGREEVVGDDGATPFCPEHESEMGSPGWLDALDWVIIGGESGRNARPCDVAWIRHIVRQCREAGVSPWVKQLGARIHWGAFGGYSSSNMQSRAFGGIAHSAGADPSEWPSDVRVQEFPEGLR